MKKVFATLFVVAGLALVGCSGGDSQTIDTSKGQPAANNRKPEGQSMDGTPAAGSSAGSAPAANGGSQVETPTSVGK